MRGLSFQVKKTNQHRIQTRQSKLTAEPAPSECFLNEVCAREKKQSEENYRRIENNREGLRLSTNAQVADVIR